MHLKFIKMCVDEVDQSLSTQKWYKKAAEQLQKLSNHCSLTARLDCNFILAGGAYYVMLGCSSDIKIELAMVLECKLPHWTLL